MFKKKVIPQNLINMSGYFLSSAFSKLATLLLLPMLTYYLSPSDFGRWSIYNTLFMLLVPFSGAVLRNHIARKFYKSSHSELKKQISTIILINLALSAISLIGFVLISSLWSTLFEIPIYFYFVVPILLFINNIKETTLLVLRYRDAVKKYVFIEISQGLINAIALLVLMNTLEIGWEIMLISFLTSLFIVSLIGMRYLILEDLFNFDFDAVAAKESFKIGIHLIPHSISGFVIAMSDRFILEHKMGVAAVGIYSLAATLAGAITMYTNAYNKVWGPWVTKSMSNVFDRKAKIQCVKYTYLYVISLVMVLLVALVFIHYAITYFLDSRYADAYSPVFLLALGVFFQGMYFSFFHYMVYLGKTKIFALLTSSAAIINVLLNLVIIDLLGIEGAAISTAIAYLIMFLGLFFYSHKHSPLPWFYFLRREKL